MTTELSSTENKYYITITTEESEYIFTLPKDENAIWKLIEIQNLIDELSAKTIKLSKN